MYTNFLVLLDFRRCSFRGRRKLAAFDVSSTSTHVLPSCGTEDHQREVRTMLEELDAFMIQSDKMHYELFLTFEEEFFLAKEKSLLFGQFKTK